jgi:ribosomal protein L29
MAKTKKNSKEDLKGMTKGELDKKLAGAREEVRTIHFKSEGSRSKNVKELAGLKKQIARILTQLRQA